MDTSLNEQTACTDLLEHEVRSVVEAARVASRGIALTSDFQRNEALRAMAQALRTHTPVLLEANAADVCIAQEAGTKESLIDRLLLTPERIEDMAAALEDLVSQADPVGQILEERTLPNGIKLERISVPLGVVAVVYEARPNVTADAAGICLKAGNATVLRGGSLATRSNAAMTAVLAQAAIDAGMPQGSITSIASTDRRSADVLMQLYGLIDVLVPRGGAGLIQHCIQHSKVPVIETGTGNCHIYVHESADPQMARDILINAKCRRYGVCNAAETLLIDRLCAPALLPDLLGALAEKHVLIHGDAETCKIAQAIGLLQNRDFCAADESDWETEYLAPEIAVRCVSGLEEAIEHVNRYSTKHSEAIVANAQTQDGAAAIETFLARVDAAAVYANASTAFTDGGQFGLGAEIGISTQKLHARGPFAAEALTSYKYVLHGTGQIRA